MISKRSLNPKSFASVEAWLSRPRLTFLAELYMYIAYTRRFSAFLRNALIAPKKRLSFYNSHRQVDKSWAFSPIRKTLTAATTNGVMWNSNNFITKKESYTIVAAAAAALPASCIDFPFLGSEISYVCARICFHYSNFVNRKKRRKSQ